MATGNQVLRAYSRAVKRMQKEHFTTRAQESAGFIFAPGQKRGKRRGLQVFVTVCRYDDEVLESCPLSGGLLCELPND